MDSSKPDYTVLKYSWLHVLSPNIFYIVRASIISFQIVVSPGNEMCIVLLCVLPALYACKKQQDSGHIFDFEVSDHHSG